MWRKLLQTLTVMIATALVVSSLAMAAGTKTTGTVTAMHKNGTMTVQTENGKMHRVKGHDFQRGDHVECSHKGKTMACRKQAV